MQEIAPGLHRWTAAHPDWTPEEGGPDGWEREVACLAWEGDDALVLIDPLVPVGGEDEQDVWTELDALASAHDRQVAIVLTVFWHERSAGHVLERYSKTLGARVYAHEGGGIDRIECPVTDPFGEGDSLPGGIDWFEVERGNEVVLWLPRPRALVPGDVLLGRKTGLRLCPASWLDGEEELERARASLRRLLDLPLEMVLVSHGPPVLEDGRGALAEALDRNARAGD